MKEDEKFNVGCVERQADYMEYKVEMARSLVEMNVKMDDKSYTNTKICQYT